MRTIRDVMSGDVDVLRTTDTAADAACFLASHGEDSAPLCQSDGSLAGTVSARDIVAQVVAKGRDPRQVSLAEFTDAAGDVVASTSTSPSRTPWPSCADISGPGSPCSRRNAWSAS